MRTVRRILVAVKEPMAKPLPAVDKAAQLARAFGADIELFHAISSPRYLGLDGLDNGGNTARYILDEVGCDVLVVKPPGFPNRIPHATREARLVATPPERQ